MNGFSILLPLPFWLVVCMHHFSPSRRQACVHYARWDCDVCCISSIAFVCTTCVLYNVTRFFQLHVRKRESLVKSVMCVTSGGTDFLIHIWVFYMHPSSSYSACKAFKHHHSLLPSPGAPRSFHLYAGS